jgi:ATP-dependent HslUV protease subunit HslV
MKEEFPAFHATTIIAVRRNGVTAIAGDGQVSLGASIIKGNARKVRRLNEGRIVAGFAGAVADAFTLFDQFEKRLSECGGDLARAAVDLARQWRTDKMLRQLQAMLLAADKDRMLLISGTGEVIEPETPVMAIGSGGDHARSAALALLENTSMEAPEIARKALGIASRICVYTNDVVTLEQLG